MTFKQVLGYHSFLRGIVRLLCDMVSTECLESTSMNTLFMTQHQKENVRNCGLGVSPSQAAAHLKRIEEKNILLHAYDYREVSLNRVT
jgi:hypothetical protein